MNISLLLIGFTFLGHVLGHDPCWFVGFRFGKTRSECIDGTCSGLFFASSSEILVPQEFVEGRPDDEFIAVSCDRARTIMTDYLKQVNPVIERKRPWRSVTGLPPDVLETLHNINQYVITASWNMLFSRVDFGQEVIDIMTKIDWRFLAYLNDDSAWPILKREILDSLEFKKIIKLWNVLIEWNSTIPHPVSQMSASLLHFLFDLISIVGPVDGMLLRRDDILSASVAVGGYPVRHRHPYTLELRGELGLRTDTEPATAVLVSNAMIQLRENTSDLEAFFIVYSFASGLSNPRLPSASATEDLLRRQFSTDICPVLYRVVYGSFLYRKLTKPVVRLIHHCRNSLPSSELIATSLLLSCNHGQEHRILHHPDTHELMETLTDEAFAWDLGFDTSDPPNAWTVRLFLNELIDRFEPFMINHNLKTFRPRSRFRSGKEFEQVMRYLGRALGLCTRFSSCNYRAMVPRELLESILEPIPDDVLFNAIWTSAKRELNETQITRFLQDVVREPVFYIQLGLKDVLGPAGVYAIASIEYW
jgi:hypothetical protein